MSDETSILAGNFATGVRLDELEIEESTQSRVQLSVVDLSANHIIRINQDTMTRHEAIPGVKIMISILIALLIAPQAGQEVHLLLRVRTIPHQD